MSSFQDVPMLSAAPSPLPIEVETGPMEQPDTAQRPRMDDLPPEVMVQVFHMLGMTDRLSLLRTSKTLQGVYNESSTLQYDLALRTSAYLDVPFEHPDTEEYLDAAPSIAVAPSVKPDDEQERGRGRASARLGDSTTLPHPSVSFPFRFDPPLSARVHRPAKRPLGAAEKATMLIERERRWGKLSEAAERRFEIQGPAGVYELQEGIFLMCEHNTVSGDGRPSIVRLVPLPSAEDPDLDNPSIPLKSAKLPFAIADVTMDPTQDLIVVSEYRPMSGDPTAPAPRHRYHLLTLSDFAPHPLASLPILEFPPYIHPIITSRQLLQVMGDVLVILVSRFIAALPIAGVLMGMPLVSNGNEEEVVCWNWKTGRVLSRIALPENGWFASLTVLTPTTFMITSTSNVSQLMDSEDRPNTASMFPPVIQIYSFAPDPSVNVNPSQPLISELHDDTTPRPVLLTQLELPRFAPGASVSTFDVRPDPAFPPRVPGPQGESSGPRIGGSKHFTQDPSKGVLVFDLQISEPAEGFDGGENAETAQYELFVLRDTLVELAQEGEERLRTAREAGGSDRFERSKVEESIRWDDWGRHKARLMNASMSRRSWVCSCSGYRFISLIPSDDVPPITPEHHDNMNDPPRRSDLRLFDFSPYSVRKQQGLSKITSSPWDKLQDVPTSSAPVSLTESDIRALLKEMGQWDDELDNDSPLRHSEREREQVFARARKQYHKMFHAESARADRSRSDRADRERGRGRAGGTRSDSASQSRSRSRSQHHLHGRHHPPSGSHSRPRHHYSPSPGPGPSLFGPEGMRERRSRSRTPRSVSPAAIFRRASQPINMAGPGIDMEMLDGGEEDIAEGEEEEDEDYEVRVVTAPTVLERRKVWRDDVISGLQFKEIWRRKEMRANGVMIDDQRVIVVCTEGKRDRQDWNDVRQTMTVLCM